MFTLLLKNILHGNWGPGFATHKFFQLQFPRHLPWTSSFSVCLKFLQILLSVDVVSLNHFIVTSSSEILDLKLESWIGSLRGHLMPPTPTRGRFTGQRLSNFSNFPPIKSCRLRLARNLQESATSLVFWGSTRCEMSPFLRAYEELEPFSVETIWA